MVVHHADIARRFLRRDSPTLHLPLSRDCRAASIASDGRRCIHSSYSVAIYSVASMSKDGPCEAKARDESMPLLVA